MAYFEVEQSIKQCIQQAQEEYHADLDAAVIEEIEDPDHRHQELLARLDRLGPINPLSVSEYGKEKQRLDDILRQRDDVVQAKTTLETSIKELDQEARSSFLTTFQQVREHFQRVFTNFFVGGEADLLLSDDVSPFESTIEIVARPMGKKLKHIHQLSTGEQTLLAISLMFAFYFVRPSPFCIIDEIDAPLDDANVVRFSEFLRDLASKTQILLITHNKVTMEYADYIYGVTMQEPGASKIVSMKLKELTSALESS
jgi:chromosome segregation protein